MFTPELNKVLPSDIDQILADNSRFRRLLRQQAIIESLSQPTQIHITIINRVDLSFHVELPGEQEDVDDQINNIMEHKRAYPPYCVKCCEYLEEDSEEEWCSFCHPVHGTLSDFPLPKTDGVYKPRPNFNICDTYYVKSGVVDIWTEGQPNLFKFK